MGLYLYCLGYPSHPRPEDGDGAPPGLDGAPVRALEASGLLAWVSDLDRLPSASLDRIRVHNAVVEAAARDATPLPLRFGQWFESEAALEASLQERGDALRAALDRVAGAVEFGVRIVVREPSSHALDRTSGTAYLEGLARRARNEEEARDRGRAVAAELQEWLEGVVREERVSPLGTDTLAAVAHLVDRHDTGSYSERMSRFPARHPELRFVTSGPWPPYGFVD